MTATVAKSAAPSYAVKVWMDDVNLYAELPGTNGPTVMAFQISEGGLSKALATLGAKHITEAAGQPYLRPALIAKKLMKDGITQRELDAARVVLKELGILK